EATDQSRRLAEIGEAGAEVEDAGMRAQDRLVLGPLFPLQTDKSRVDVEQVRQHAQRQRPVVIILMVGVACPDQPDPQFVVRAEAVLPGVYARLGWKRQIG